MLFTACTLLLGIAASVCHAHRVCKPGVLCAVTTPPICKVTPPVPRPRPKPTLPYIRDACVVLDNVLHTIDPETGKIRAISSLGTTGDHGINAMGYNPKDSYLYGTLHKRLVRVLAGGSIKDVLRLPIRPNMGDFDQHGRYWCSNGGKMWASVDLDPRSKNYKRVESGRSTFPGPHADWAFAADWASTPVDDGHLYGIGVSKKPGDEYPTLVRWGLASKAWEEIYTARHLSKSHTFGAVLSTSDGVIYGLENMSGNIVRFNLYNHTDTREISGGPVSTGKPKQVDGTRCLLLPDSS